MEYLLFWFACGFAASFVAKSKGRSGGKWFLLGLILGPFALVTVGFAAPLGRIPAYSDDAVTRSEAYVSKKCPFCAEEIKFEALVCRFCGKDQPKVEKQEKKLPSRLKTCPGCGAVAQVSAEKCDKCDHKFPMAPEKIWCSECGENITHMPPVCPKCGKGFRYKTA